MKTCFETEIAGLNIRLEQKKNLRFNVRYGAQNFSDKTYREAALELGQCIMHALACEDKLDNEGE